MGLPRAEREAFCWRLWVLPAVDCAPAAHPAFPVQGEREEGAGGSETGLRVWCWELVHARGVKQPLS